MQNRFRFAGQGFDDEAKLNYNFHRYYDPSLGRYTRPDPIGLGGGTNAFLYTKNNPINSIDPFGLESLAVPGGPNFYDMGKNPNTYKYRTDYVAGLVGGTLGRGGEVAVGGYRTTNVETGEILERGVFGASQLTGGVSIPPGGDVKYGIYFSSKPEFSGPYKGGTFLFFGGYLTVDSHIICPLIS